MDNSQIQQEISIIRQMIEKTRKETAESGYFFIWVGIFSIVATYIIAALESFNSGRFVFPVLIAMVVVNGLIGYLTFSREDSGEKVKTYTKTIYLSLWFVSGMTAILIVFLFPRLDVYSFKAVPILTSLIMGIALFTTGVILDSRHVRWFSLAWWVGAVIMALVKGMPKVYIMMSVIFIGFVLPGFILNRQYKSRSIKNEF